MEHSHCSDAKIEITFCVWLFGVFLMRFYGKFKNLKMLVAYNGLKKKTYQKTKSQTFHHPDPVNILSQEKFPRNSFVT